MKTCCKHCLGAGGHHAAACPVPRPADPCRHCRLRERGLYRGLCADCYNVTAVRRLYPAERRTAPADPCRHCRRRKQVRRNLCESCYEDPAVRPLYPRALPEREPPVDPCRHCRGRERCRGRGLCAVCYGTPAIRARYQDGRKTRGPKDDPGREPGQPLWRCLWCSRYRCHQPLKICGGCQKKYEERMKTCPPWANGEH